MNAPARERPVLVAVAALAVAVGLSAALALGLPTPPAWSVRIPAWLAARLSDSAQDLVTLARPAALWLVPLAALPFLFVTVRRSLVDAPRWQLALQLLLRTAALVAVALALAMPSLQSPIAGKTVVFVVDTSASVDASQLEQARAMIEQAQGAAARGGRARPRSRGPHAPGPGIYGARADVRAIDGDTDLAALLRPRRGRGRAGQRSAAGALRWPGAALVDPQTEGRVVLLTDATGTALEREDLGRAIAELGAAGLAVHTRAPAPARARTSR
ncbi:MAG: hypothetical protein U0168_10500 [Nannocystaceae bacterium]